MTNFLFLNLGKYQEILGKCDSDLFMKIGGLYAELAQHEKSIDYYVELLRTDKLDEMVTLDGLEKTLAYFQSVYNIHLSSNEAGSAGAAHTNHSKFVQDLLEVLKHGLEALLIDLKVITQLTTSEVSMSITQMVTMLGDIDQFVKKIRRSLTSSGAQEQACVLQLSPTIEAELFDCLSGLTNLVRCFKTIRTEVFGQFTGQFAKQGDAAGEDNEPTVALITGDELDKVAKEATGNNVKGLSEGLVTVMSILAKFSTMLQQGDFDAQKTAGGEMTSDTLSSVGSSEPNSALLSMQHFNSLSSIQSRLYSAGVPSNFTCTSVPLDDRALRWRAQTDKIGEYCNKIATQETEIVELRRALRTKLDEVSEMQVRRDMAEKKLTVAQSETKRVQEELDRKVKEFIEKETERERTLNKYNQEINELYSDKRMMKEKLKSLNLGKMPPNTSSPLPNISGGAASANQSMLSNFSINQSPITGNSSISLQQQQHQQQQPMSAVNMSGDTAALQQTIIDLRASSKRMAKIICELRRKLSNPEGKRNVRLGQQQQHPTMPQWYIETLKKSQKPEDQQKLAQCIPDYREVRLNQLKLKLIEFQHEYEFRHVINDAPLVPSGEVLARKGPGWTRCLDDYFRQHKQARLMKDLDYQRRYHQLAREVEETLKGLEDGYAIETNYASFVAPHVNKVTIIFLVELLLIIFVFTVD